MSCFTMSTTCVVLFFGSALVGLFGGNSAAIKEAEYEENDFCFAAGSGCWAGFGSWRWLSEKLPAGSVLPYGQQYRSGALPLSMMRFSGLWIVVFLVSALTGCGNQLHKKTTNENDHEQARKTVQTYMGCNYTHAIALLNTAASPDYIWDDAQKDCYSYLMDVQSNTLKHFRNSGMNDSDASRATSEVITKVVATAEENTKAFVKKERLISASNR